MVPLVSPKIKRPIWLKLVAFALFFAILPASILAFTLVGSNARALKLASQEHRLGVVRSVAMGLDGELLGVERDLSRIASVLGDPAIDEAIKLSVAHVMYSRRGDLDWVSIYDAQGALIDTLREPGDAHPNPPAQLQDTWQKAPRALVAWDVKKKHGLFLVPIVPKGRTEPAGYVLGQARLDEGFIQAAQWNQDHQSAQESLVVVDDRMKTLLLAGVARGLKPEFLQEFGISLQTGRSIGRSGEVHDEEGGEVLLTVLPLGRAPWAVVAFEPASEAYQGLMELKLMVFLVLAAATLASMVVGIWSARRLTAPLEALVRFSRKLGAREFGGQMEVAASGDEVEVLGHALGQASRELAVSEEVIRQEQAIRQDLGRYLPEELVERVVGREQPMTLGGERREITVLFADVVGFTPLCEQNEPEVVVGLLNELFTIVTEIIFRHKGVVDKFMGDCVMAFWGAPDENPDHASAALSAASEIMSWLEFGNDHWVATYGVEIQLAVGVHTGHAIVGNVGSDVRMEYTAIGDVVNMAARFESVARPGQVVLSQATLASTGGAFEVRAIGGKRFVGREEKVELFELEV